MTDIATLLQRASQTQPDALTRVDAEFLMAFVLNKPRAWLYTFSDSTPSAEQAAAFASAVQRRMAGEPIAYITGMRGFWSFDLQVSLDTLIPRPETELLVEQALACVHPAHAARLLDLGTGSGAIALAIACERPLAEITAVDASQAALAIARENARRLKLTNVQFLLGDWFAPVGDTCFEFIVSNPPYIESADPHLQQGDVRYEPLTALASGSDGLQDLRSIIAQAPRHLQPGGRLLVEHGYSQGQAVRELFLQAGFSAITTERDLENRERVTMGRIS